jgi:MYXO-CTERM domain-containing protein
VKGLVIVGLLVADAHADPVCRGLDIELQPRSGLQIVAWVEDAAGTYVDTIYITETTGRRGLGNRPGDMDIRSAARWPYGRRHGVFPIWAHRHRNEFPMVVFQDEGELMISKPFDTTSRELFYDRPLHISEIENDVVSSGSALVYTDKGKLSATQTSLYPPRSDLQPAAEDHESVADFAALNIFDAVSRATPTGDALALLETRIPDLPAGTYVLRVEVSEERDFNADFPESRFPPPPMPFDEYGVPYRGQPSVLYQLPFTIAETESTTTALDYAGYSDPDAIDGIVRVPDSTITTAAERLAIVAGAPMFRVRARFIPDRDTIKPGAPSELFLNRIGPTFAGVEFVAPGDDDALGTAARYDVRLNGTNVPALPVAGGEVQEILFESLEPGTHYTVEIQAFDECDRAGPVAIFEFDTTDAGGCGCASGGSAGIWTLLVLLGIRRSARRNPG